MIYNHIIFIIILSKWVNKKINLIKSIIKNLKLGYNNMLDIQRGGGEWICILFRDFYLDVEISRM